ncbi:MAG TPA: hypothetical protein VK814_03810 [Acidobacteriaceae bacterium]|nr:hypothetical protein [Acidobacteriaceae bacterium]
MNTKLLLEYSIFIDLLITIGVLAVMARKHLRREFPSMVAFLCVCCVEDIVSIPLLFFRKHLGISSVQAYDIYFYSHWVICFAEYALLLLVIYSVFRQAMKPLVGLHRAGKIIFRWVGGVSLALSLVLALGPHTAGSYTMATFSSQVQQGISILILCLLLFVCFSTRYLGLTYRSHIFGITLGLGVFATVSLVESAWTAAGAQTVYSPVFVFSALGSCAALVTWGTYFAMPQPERKMILLPTTSPFFLWNRISEALGDEPGFVAIAGFKPDMLAAAELTAFTAGSKRAREREVEHERTARAEREVEVAQASQQAMGIHSIAMQR